MSGLEKSNVVIAKVLQLAIENGLRHWTLSFGDLGLDKSYSSYFYPCVEWLEAEGLIRVGEYARTLGGYAEGCVMNVSLTARGMALLGCPIEIDGSRMSVAGAIAKTSETSGGAYRIGEIIGGVFGGFSKSIGS